MRVRARVRARVRVRVRVSEGFALRVSVRSVISPGPCFSSGAFCHCQNIIYGYNVTKIKKNMFSVVFKYLPYKEFVLGFASSGTSSRRMRLCISLSLVLFAIRHVDGAVPASCDMLVPPSPPSLFFSFVLPLVLRSSAVPNHVG